MKRREELSKTMYVANDLFNIFSREHPTVGIFFAYGHVGIWFRRICSH